MNNNYERFKTIAWCAVILTCIAWMGFIGWAVCQLSDQWMP